MRLKEFATPKSASKSAAKDANAAEQQREKARNLKTPTKVRISNCAQRVNLKRRMLHLKEELERFCNKAIADRRLH